MSLSCLTLQRKLYIYLLHTVPSTLMKFISVLWEKNRDIKLVSASTNMDKNPSISWDLTATTIICKSLVQYSFIHHDLLLLQPILKVIMSNRTGLDFCSASKLIKISKTLYRLNKKTFKKWNPDNIHKSL